MQNILYAFNSWAQNDVLSHNHLFSGLSTSYYLCFPVNCYDFQLSNLTKDWWPGFNVQHVLLSQVTGSVSRGNLLALYLIGRKAFKITMQAKIF